MKLRFSKLVLTRLTVPRGKHNLRDPARIHSYLVVVASPTGHHTHPIPLPQATATTLSSLSTTVMLQPDGLARVFLNCDAAVRVGTGWQPDVICDWVPMMLYVMLL
jgi:hypothetical protein